MWKSFVVAVYLSVTWLDTVSSLTLPIRVALKTCSDANSDSASPAFAVSWTFPTSSAITTKPLTANFDKAATSGNYWFTVLDTSMVVNPAVFTSAISAKITITANTNDAMCISKLTVNGIYVTGLLPMFLDNPCSSSVGCSASFVGTFLLYPPLYPINIRFTTCNIVTAESLNEFLLEFPSQSMATTIETVGGLGLSVTQTVYLKTYLQSQTMKISAQSSDAWCILDITVESRATSFTPRWLDNPCTAAAYTTYSCFLSNSFTFTLGSPTTMPTRKPTVRPTIAPSSSKPSAKPTAVPTAPTAKPTTAVPTYTVTQNPTAKPTTAVPTYTVTQNPTAVPTTASPSARPTAAPSVLPDEILSGILASPTYKATCNFGFAAIFPETGAVASWGKLVGSAVFEDNSGATSAVTIAPSSALKIIPSRTAFAAHFSGEPGSESITAWGATTVIAGSMVQLLGLSVRALVANDFAFAGITAEGSVLALGSASAGGNVMDDTKCNGFSLELSTNISSLYASSASFAAITDGGDVYAWGNKYTGGGVSTLTKPELSNIVDMAATRTAFAAITHDRALITWGDKMGGGDSSVVASQLTTNVMRVIGSQSVFVAFKFDGSLVVWGNTLRGANVTAVAPLLGWGVKFVTFTAQAVAALKFDGSVVTWGVADSGGDSTSVSGVHNIVKVFAAKHAFAALTSTGGVVAWGDPLDGGLIPSAMVTILSSDVVSISATDRAFAALKSIGTVVLWGNPHFGADPGAAAPYLASGVTALCANDVAFTAMKSDGHAVVWGHPASIPFPGLLESDQDFALAVCAE